MTSQGDSSQLPLNLQIIMTVAYVSIFVISLVGNMTMVYVIFKAPNMKTTTNLLLANMAIADLMITFFVMPSCIVYLYLQNLWFSGTFGDITCRTVHYLWGLSIAASILTHVLIAAERFFCIVFPFKRVTYIKNSKTNYSFIWGSSFTLMIPYLVVFGSVQFGPGENSYCVVKKEFLKILQIHISLVFVLLYALPLLFIATLYTVVCRKLWKQKSPGVRSQTAVQNRETRKRKTVKMLIILVTVFAICWLPVHVMHLFLFFWYNTVIPTAIYLLSFWACHSHSAINPLLVAIFNSQYQKACREMIRNFRKSGQPPKRESHESANVRLVPLRK